jgi:hypothetical protein
MTADFCIEAVEEALAKYGKPDRPHSSHGGATPDRVYFDNLPQAAAA